MGRKTPDLFPQGRFRTELMLKNGAPEYFYYAKASHETGKATYDLLVGDDG